MNKLCILVVFCLFMSCTNKQREIKNSGVNVYLSLDFERINKEVAKVWINDSLIFNRIFFYNNSESGIDAMKVATINRIDRKVKFKIQLINIDKDFYYHKRFIDTTFFYNVYRYDAIQFAYYKIYNGFRIFNNLDNPEQWEVE